MIVAELGTVFAADSEPERDAIFWINAAAAADCGVDAVKVQMFVPDEPLFCPMPGDDKRWERWSKTYMSLPRWERLYADVKRELGIELFASAFQNTAVDWCNELGFKWHKVASRAYLTYPYEKISNDNESAHNVLISNGMRSAGGKLPWGHTLMYCVAEYPTPLSKAFMPVFRYEENEYRAISDHSGTSWPALHALANGADIIEVHFALDKEMAGPDAPVCLDKDQLKLICDFRDALKEMGRCSA